MLSRVLAPTGRLDRWGVCAALVCGAAWSLAVAAIVLQVVHAVRPPSTAYWLSDVLSAVAYGAVTLVMLPRSRHPVAWIMAAVALGSGFAGFSTQYYLLGTELTGVPAADLVVVTGGWLWIPGTYASVAVLPWVVTARQPRWARAAAGCVVAAAALVVLRLVTLEYVGVDNPAQITIRAWQVLIRGVGLWPDRFCVVVAALGTGWLIYQRVRSPGDEGRGLGWLAAGQLSLTLALVPTVFVELGSSEAEVSGILVILAQLFLPAGLLVVVLRQQLWGVDLAVSRVTVWTLMTSSVLAGYALLAWLLGQVLPGSDGMPGSGGMAGFVAVGLVVAIGQPLRFWIQERVDRLVYGHAADPVRLLGTLDRDLRGGDAGNSLEALTAAVRRGLRLGGVEVRSTDGATRATAGNVQHAELELPLTVEGRHLGDLLVAAPPGQRIDARTRRLVEPMVGVLGVALELAQVNERLAAARDRLVEVRQEERRMLRRDIHDGMGPALAGVGLGLAAAQRRLAHDPEGTAALLAELEAEVERRTEDVRLLARALLPAQLDDGDLGRALEVLADRFRSSGLLVETDCSRLGPLETRRQVAVYHVAAEALMNAYRHARAALVRVVVGSTVDGSVVLEVVDDGQGIGDGRRGGIGLQSMRERAAELGGDLLVTPRPDGPGTRVRMVLP